MTSETNGTGMTSDERDVIRALVRSEMRAMIGEVIAEYQQLIRPDSVEIDEDSKGIPHPKIKVYANNVATAATDAVSAYVATRAALGLPPVK